MCEICRKNPCDFRCPNYKKRKSDYYCSICGEGIISGEEYVRNENGDYVHEDCIPGCRWLLRWLGYDVGIME